MGSPFEMIPQGLQVQVPWCA